MILYVMDIDNTQNIRTWDMNDRQKLQRVRVAAYNPNPRWPAGYFYVLEELGE